MSGIEVQIQERSEFCGKADDPADYLFKSTKYHDCKVTVTDPVTKKVKDFSVVSSDLAAHSPVFRALLEDKQNDPKALKIDNISPEVFKLMLIFVYGGELPILDRATAAQLALGAMAYDIKKLVAEASKRVEPTSVDDVFPALFVVAHIDQPLLSPQVKKIIQEQTDDLLKKEEFLELDQKCIDFIASQEQLGVSEIELWNSLVKWSENKALKADQKGKSLRDILYNTLQYIRFASMNQNDIIKEVMPKKILSSGEVTDLLLAVSSNLPWQCPGMCKNNKQRELCDGPVTENDLTNNVTFEENCTFAYANQPCPINGSRYPVTRAVSDQYQKFSALSIKTTKAIELQSVTLQSRSIAKEGSHLLYNMSCTFTVYKHVKGFCKDSKVIQLGGAMVFCDNEIEFPLKLRNGHFLVLEADCSYIFSIVFATEHPVYKLKCGAGCDHIKTEFKLKGMNISAFNEVHVKQITYRI